MKTALVLGASALLAGMFQPTAPPVKMGLWETTSTSTMSGDGLPPQLAGMSGRSSTVRYCIDKDTYQKSMGGENRAGCTRSGEVWGAKSFSFDVSCTSGAKSHVELTFETMDTYRIVQHGSMAMRGNTVKIDGQGSSHFVSADCGTLKPGAVQVVK